ncbi:MAG: hypothetical protein BWY78_01421 [Alphaproteobacteria bacterium ADurb.Bin438]|nr:MAG: hypothetical protein BWY78_01421 [Alphaproteobacteria bacterium ADurb.Bin438]
MEFNQAIKIIEQGFFKAFNILQIMPIRVYPFSFVKNFIKPNKAPKQAVSPKDIDFMDEVLFKWFKALDNDEALIVTGYALKAKRKEIAAKFNLSRQGLHKRYEKALAKVLFYLISQGVIDKVLLDNRA